MIRAVLLLAVVSALSGCATVRQPDLDAWVAARVKVVVASVMQPTVEYDQHPNASL
jgi:uncharacterized protein YceK